MKTYFRTNTIYHQSPALINREDGIIKDIVLCQVGEAKGHDLFINDSFIDKVIHLGNENKTGIKARFGHPNICSTALGTYLGRYKNFRKQDDKAIADLYLDKTSKKSPNGNLFDYVLDLAESNPDMFGASIAFKAGKADKKMESLNGAVVEKNYATIVGLYAADLVDDPAATNGLFEALHEDEFAFQVSVFLDEHPEIYHLLDKKPEILNEFMTNYKNHKNEKNMSLTDEINKLRKWVTDNFSNKKDSPLLSLSKQGEMPQAEGLRTEFESKLSEIESNLKDHENTEILDSEIDTQFEHASKIHTDHNLTVSTTDVVAPGAKIQYVSNVLLQAESLLKSQQDTINQLQSDLNKSKAYPTMPDKKADPKINIHKKINTDDSGKVLLENIPDNVKRKLKTK